MRILTWNLFHGRAKPERRGYLLSEFAETIAAWDWDVALLQEVPPWWPRLLALTAGAQARSVLTSRNEGLLVRRAIATCRPDLIKSHGGGANAILLRPSLGSSIVIHARRRLRRRPERRVVHAIKLGGGEWDGLWIANIHAHDKPHVETRLDLALAARTVARWSGGGPALLGGDLNVPDPKVDGWADLDGHRIDRVLAHGPLVRRAKPVVPAREGSLSDHAPVLLDVDRAP